MKDKNNRTDYVVKLADPKKNHSVLTIGVAHIPEIEMILEKVVRKCSCIDFDLKKVKHAKKYLKNTEFILEDITKVNKKLFNKFDTIIMLEVLEHIQEDKIALKNIHNMLKRKGKLIISVPNKHILHLINPVKYTQHKRHYALKEIIKLLKNNGFDIDFKNTVESPKILIDLYAHLFCKYVLRRSLPFGILTGKRDKTYSKYNSENEGLDSLIVAKKR